MLRSDTIAAAPTTARSATAPTRDLAVLHLFKYFRPDFTGEGLYLEKLIPHLARLGVCNDIAAETTRGVAPAGVRLFGRGRLAWINPRLLAWFLLNAWRYQAVHFHSPVDRFFVYHAVARLYGCRVVQSCTLEDGLGSLVDGYRPAYRGAIRRLCRLITHMVAISPRLHDDTLAVLPAARVHLIPQGVALPAQDADARADARHHFGVPVQDTVLLFVGGLCARKDVRFLVDQHPAELHRLHLLLVGPALEDGYVAELQAAIAASPSAARIRLAGYMDDPAPAYRAADVFVFASRKEGFGNVLLEAMAHGLPVVCRRLPGITDSFIRHGQTGILFDTEAEYGHAVRTLAADPEARLRIGAAARQSAADSHDLRSMAARYADLYGRAA